MVEILIIAGCVIAWFVAGAVLSGALAGIWGETRRRTDAQDFAVFTAVFLWPFGLILLVQQLSTDRITNQRKEQERREEMADRALRDIMPGGR